MLSLSVRELDYLIKTGQITARRIGYRVLVPGKRWCVLQPLTIVSRFCQLQKESRPMNLQESNVATPEKTRRDSAVLIPRSQ